MCSFGNASNFLDNVGRGYTDEEQKRYGLVFDFTESSDLENSIKKGIELLQTPDLKLEWKKRRHKMLSEKIDVTAFMVWFIENYPKSAKVMKENPSYQYCQESIFKNKLFMKFFRKESLNNYLKLHDSILSVPISPSLSKKEMDYIIKQLNKC